MLLVASTYFGMAAEGDGLPGIVGIISGDSRRPFSEEHAPCGPGNECNRETMLPEQLTTPLQPEPTIELPAPVTPCKECARITEITAAHVVTATMARCLERCETRKGGVRRRLDAVNEEIRTLQAQQLAQSETRRQREELSKYHELLQQATTFAGGQPSYSTAQSALAQAQTAREQLKLQNQQVEEMRKTINELRSQVRANEDPGGGASEPMGMGMPAMGPYRFQM